MALLRVPPLEVVLSRIRVGEVSYPRPCVVLEVDANDVVSLMPCSTSFDLYRNVQDFPICYKRLTGTAPASRFQQTRQNRRSVRTRSRS